MTAFLQKPSNTMRQAPELLYRPDIWSASRQQQWNESSPEWRVFRMSAPRGWIKDCMPVLPSHLEFAETVPRKICFNGFVRCPVTVIINPYPYVALTSDLRSLCELDVLLQENNVSCRVQYLAKKTTTWNDFRGWRVEGAEGILEQLEKCYRGSHGGAGELIGLFGDFEKLVQETAEQAARGRVNDGNHELDSSAHEGGRAPQAGSNGRDVAGEEDSDGDW